MTIQMVRGYSQPPASGGAAYHGLDEQFGYTYVTQEGERESDPHADAFSPVEHWNGYDEGEHPYVDLRRPPGLSVPGALGACCGGCGGRQMGDAGGSGATGPGYTLPSPIPMGSGMLTAGAAVLAAFFLLRKPKRPSFGRAPKRRRRSRR